MKKNILHNFIAVILWLGTVNLSASEFLNTGYVTGGLGGVMVSGSDLSAGPRDFDGQLAPLWDGGIGYQLENGIELELGYIKGPLRDSLSSDSVEQWEFHQQTLFASLGFNVPMGRSGLVGLRLAAGPSWIRGTLVNKDSANFPSVAIRANNVSWMPSARAEILLGGHLGLGATVGLHFSQFNDVRWEVLPGIFFPLVQATPSADPVVLKNTGFLGRIYLKLYFEELL